MPFDLSARDGVLTLTLDTPGSAVNIFNHATAHQLVDVLAGVSPSNTRAIVFETAKPRSFINGVGLLLAHTSRSAEDVERASGPPWAAYRAVREAPVPTIAVVQGNCFGCGVEFVLNCDYRLAADTCETRFYMTELNDYLFVPLFGSTWNLPHAVGLDAAIDLLLWGPRWDASTAHARGLVDEVAPHEALGERRARFVERVLAGTQPSRRRGAVAWGDAEQAAVERAERRIARLPAVYRRVYTDALELLAAGARRRTSLVEHQREELRCSAASALSPIGKAAYAFFYLRQMASERASGRPQADGGALTLGVDLDGDRDARDFVDDLRHRKLPGVRFVEAGAPEIRLVSPGRRVDRHVPLTVTLEPALGAQPTAEVALYAPAWRAGGRLVELATPAGREPGGDAVPGLARALQRFGFEVARTAPTDRFVTSRLLVAYMAPLVRAVGGGDDPRLVNGALSELGFVQLPAELAVRLGHAAVVREVGSALGVAAADVDRALTLLARPPAEDGAGAERVVDALCVSLLDAVLTARARREIRDPTIADLIARELLDFPRHLSSLATWLKIRRVAHALEHEGDVRALAGDAACASARGFVEAGRELYR